MRSRRAGISPGLDARRVQYLSAIARPRLSALSPVVSFPIAWAIGILLGQIHLLRSQQNWSAEVWLVLAVVPVAFLIGAFAGRWVAGRFRERWLNWGLDEDGGASWGPSNRTVLIACTAVGWLELIHQFAAAGTVPLLSSNIDVARFALPGGPSVILTNLLAIAIVLALVRPRQLFSREAMFEWAIVLVCLSGYALQGGRGSLVLPIVVALIARWAFWGRPRLPVVAWLALALAGLITISGIFFARSTQESGAFQAEFYAKVLPGTPSVLYPLVPIDLAYATNFQTLAAVIGHFPDDEPYAGGAFSASALDRVIPGARDLSTTTNQINPPWTTATLAGPLWADGGLVVVIIGSALTGLLTNLAYWLYRRTRQLRFALLSSYFLYLALFGIYTSLWTQQPDWLLLIPGLLLAGTFAQRGLPEGEASWERQPRAPGTDRSRVRRHVVVAVITGAACVALAGVVLASVVPPGGKELTGAGHLAASAGSQVGPSRAVTDSGSEDATSLIYRLRRDPDGTRLRADPLSGSGGKAVRIAGRTAAGAGYDVYTEPGKAPRLYRFEREGPRRISYRVSNVASGEITDTGTFRIDALPRGDQRRLFVANWRGTTPKLFVVDSGPERDPGIQVRTASSGFDRVVARRSVGLAKFDPENWDFDVFDMFNPLDGSPPSADLVATKFEGSIGNAEEHVISGESGLHEFAVQRVIALRAADARGLTFLAARVLDNGVVLALDLPHAGSGSDVRAADLFDFD